MLPLPSGPPALGLGCGNRLTPLHQGWWLEARVAGEHLLYKIMGRPPRAQEGKPLPPPLPPLTLPRTGKPILGLPCSLRETLLPPSLPRARAGWSGAPTEETAWLNPTTPAHPMLLALPHPPYPPQTQTQDSSTQQQTRQGGGRRQAGLEDGALLPRLLHRGRAQHCPDGLVEHRLQASLSQG